MAEAQKRADHDRRSDRARIQDEYCAEDIEIEPIKLGVLAHIEALHRSKRFEYFRPALTKGLLPLQTMD